jgi:hypothetical protein
MEHVSLSQHQGYAATFTVAGKRLSSGARVVLVRYFKVQYEVLNLSCYPRSSRFFSIFYVAGILLLLLAKIEFNHLDVSGSSSGRLQLSP